MTNYCYRMSFFSRGNHGRNNGGRGNWHQGHMRPRFSIHFDVDPQVLNRLFQVGFFNLVAHGILHPRPERPLFQQPQNFPGIHVPPHVSMQPEPPPNDSWQEIVNQPTSHCLVGPLSHFHYHYHCLQLIIMHKFPMLFQ